MPCTLCSSDAPLSPISVPGGPDGAATEICDTCRTAMDTASEVNHWRCLSSSMWSEDTTTQVLAARILNQLTAQDWARDLSDQLWLDEDTRAWVDNIATTTTTLHKDSNGTPLTQGDTVVLVKDLPVKGAGFTAKRGTAVRGISLVDDNPEHIEGRVEGQRIVILTQFVKKKP